MKLLGLQLRQSPNFLSYGLLVLFAVSSVFFAFYKTTTCATASVNPTDFCARISIGITNSSSDVSYAPVRIPFISQGMQDLNYIDNFGSQAVGSDSTYNDLSYMNQQLNSTDSAGWWFTLPALIEETETLIDLYVGSLDQDSWRDNGFYFYNVSSGTDDLVTVTNNANFNITNNLSLETDVVLTQLAAWDCPLGVPSVDTGFLIDRWDTNNGYAIGVECEEQTLYNFVQIGSTKVRSAAPTSYGTRYNLKATYIAPDIVLSVNDVIANTGTVGSMASHNAEITMGNNLNKTWLLNAQISKNIITTNDIELNLIFNANDMEETTASTPSYSGTINDVSGNSHTVQYEMNRPQPYALTIATVVGVGFQDFVINPPLNQNILPALNTDLITYGDENTNFPFYPMISSAAQNSGMPRQMMFGGLFTVLAMIISSLLLLATRTIPLAILTYGVVMYLGYLNNFYAIWYVLATIFILIAAYGSSKYLSEGF